LKKIAEEINTLATSSKDFPSSYHELLILHTWNILASRRDGFYRKKNDGLLTALYHMLTFCLLWVRAEETKPENSTVAEMQKQTEIYIKRFEEEGQ
jgi:tRNA U34 5-methylaminomethyl-2-thiouridine-forming methyltransferase MnmC